jgi:hypothetical protein
VHPLLAALLTLMAVTPASPQGVIKLPIVAEITGGGASVGAMWRDAVNLAVEDINKKGGESRPAELHRRGQGSEIGRDQDGRDARWSVQHPSL